MILRSVSPIDRAALETTITAFERETGSEAISEHKRLRLLADEVIEVAAFEGRGAVVGYAQAAWHGGGTEAHWAIEVFVADGNVGTWSTLLERITATIPGTRRRRLWVTRPAALAAAVDVGWRVDRTLHEMHRALPVDAATSISAGIEIAPFGAVWMKKAGSPPTTLRSLAIPRWEG